MEMDLIILSLKKKEDIINSIIKYDPQMSVYRQELLKKEISELFKIKK